MNSKLIEIRMVMHNEVEFAWNIFLAVHNDYSKRHDRRPERMSFIDFEDLYNENDKDFYFVLYESQVIGTFYVVNVDDYNKNLARIWINPVCENSDIIPIVVNKFEGLYEKANMWSLGDCQLKRADIETCVNNGWQVTSLIESMNDGVIIAHLEKHSK
ncbi:MAG: hypothetical protein K6E47_07980 [Lachnospiraceae bacterium]|nr:hypothetical protein [Lachnospiraceae bacterium]